MERYIQAAMREGQGQITVFEGMDGTVGDTEVRSAFAGQLVEFLALPGERVQLAQPIAWLRST